MFIILHVFLENHIKSEHHLTIFHDFPYILPWVEPPDIAPGPERLGTEPLGRAGVEEHPAAGALEEFRCDISIMIFMPIGNIMNLSIFEMIN